MAIEKREFYIDGRWVLPEASRDHEVIDPATEEPAAVVSLGSKADLDKAVGAARRAFKTFGRTTKAERLTLLKNLLRAMEKRQDEFACSISMEMGAPITLATNVHTIFVGIGRLKETIAALERFEEESQTHSGGSVLLRQPIGVCGLITPWNWPLNQIAQKVFPALAVGCTMVLKPSLLSPLDAILLAECVDEAGYPPGVFNLVNGNGSEIGEMLASHPDVDMVSLTGSERAGVAVSKAAADTIKRVALELGGKAPNLIFSDADLDAASQWSVQRVMMNSGQTCTAPTRLLVQNDVYDQVLSKITVVCNAIKIGDPAKPGDHMGPVVSRGQYDTIQKYIQSGIDEGGRIIAGGLGKPDGMNRGYYVRPTIFADCHNGMKISREEIFAPVISVIPFKDEEEAVEIANDTDFGLSGYLHTGNKERARYVARAIDAGMIGINGSSQGLDAPFGGFKRSGNGREGSDWGLEEYTEIKAITA